MARPQIVGCLKYVTVEPVLLFTFLGLVIYQIVRDTALYRTVCLQKYEALPGVDCRNLSGRPEIENNVQRETTLWIMSYSLAVLLPAMFTDILLGAWGDRRGRKTNMLLGIVGTVICVLPLMFLITFEHSPIYMVLFPNLVCGLMGSSAIVMVSSYAFLADHITDHNLLTVRMAIVSVSLSTALISGSYLAGILLRYLTFNQTLSVVIGLLTIGFFYCLVRIEEKPPTVHHRIMSDAIEEEQEEPKETDSLLRCSRETACGRCCREVILTVRAAKTLLKETWHTFTQQRPRNHRAYMLIGVACFLVVTLADFQGNVITLFVYRHPLNWSPPMLATWKAINGCVNLLGGLIGAVFLKRLLKVHDTTLILIGMICATAQNITFGLSTKTWMVYMSSALGLFSTIVQPTIFSLTSRLVRKNEVGKAFAGFTLAAETALILSVALLNAIYQATVSFYPGVVFFFVAGCVALMFIPMLWVHLNYDEEGEDRRKRIRDETGRDDDDDRGTDDEGAHVGGSPERNDLSS